MFRTTSATARVAVFIDCNSKADLVYPQIIKAAKLDLMLSGIESKFVAFGK